MGTKLEWGDKIESTDLVGVTLGGRVPVEIHRPSWIGKLYRLQVQGGVNIYRPVPTLRSK